MLIIYNVLSCVQLSVTPWTKAHQASLSMEFFRQEYWSGLPFLTQGNLSNPGIKPLSMPLQHWQADSLSLLYLESPICTIHTFLKISFLNFVSLDISLSIWWLWSLSFRRWCLPNPGIEPGSPASLALAGEFLPLSLTKVLKSYFSLNICWVWGLPW